MQARVSGTRIFLSWNAPEETGSPAFTGFRVEWAAGANGPWTELVELGKVAYYFDQSVARGQTRYYRVAARHAAGAAGLGPWTAPESATVPAPLVAEPDRFRVTEDTPTELAVLANDTSGGGALAIRSFTQPAHGRTILQEGAGPHQLRYEPAANYHGPDGFEYTVTDTTAAEATAAVTLTVEAVNDAPVFGATESGHRTVAEHTAAGQAIGAPVAATDVEDPALTYRLAGPDAALFDLDATRGQLRVGVGTVVDYEQRQQYTVEVVATDGGTPALQTTQPVTITVTDVDEAGVVTLGAQPVVTVAFTATLVDPDAPVTGPAWQWEQSSDQQTWAAIPGATEARYTPAAADQGAYLRVTVTYTDAHGAQTVTSAPSVPVTKKDTNVGPRFAAAATERRVAENTGAGGAIGAPVTATDADDEVQFLRYALAGPDAALFRLEATSGQLRVGAGTVVDYEQRPQYTVVVTVMDPAGATAEVTVTIVVTDVDEAPVVTGPETVVVVEGAVAVATYTATDPEGAPLMWAVTGPDAGQFTMDAGVVRFREAPDYEHPTDTGGENTYAVTVVVGTAPGAPEATVSVRVQVGDAVGTVVVTPGAGHVGVPRTAMLDELDTPVTGLTWQWEWTAEGTTWGTLTGATAAEYTPRAADIGQRLRVVATYTDGDGTGKQVASAPSAPVTARPRVVGPRGGGGGGSGGGGGGAPAERPAPVGYLENPGAASFQSGIGVLSGWVCDAAAVEIEIEAETGAVHRFEAAYGTERLDTLEVCDDTDNGFGLLFNWNRLGDGAHEVVAFVDDVELGRATVTVTTLGEEFLRGVEGECVVEDFPDIGQTVPLEWQQTQQNFVLAGGPAPEGSNRAGVAGVGYLENPGPNSFQSGIGVISGWVCEAEEVLITLNGEPQPAAYGTERWIRSPCVGIPIMGLGCCSTGTGWATASIRWWPGWMARS